MRGCEELTFVTIGYRSDTTVEMLKKLKKFGIPKKETIENAYKLVQDSELVLWDTMEGYLENEDKHSAYIEIFLHDRPGMSLQEIGAQIGETKTTLEDMMFGEGSSMESLDIAINFFEYLAKRCKILSSKYIHQHYMRMPHGLGFASG